MGGFECERVDMKWLALCTDGSTECDKNGRGEIIQMLEGKAKYPVKG